MLPSPPLATTYNDNNALLREPDETSFFTFRENFIMLVNFFYILSNLSIQHYGENTQSKKTQLPHNNMK